jgi:hypothetical protein
MVAILESIQVYQPTELASMGEDKTFFALLTQLQQQAAELTRAFISCCVAKSCSSESMFLYVAFTAGAKSFAI